MLNYESMISRQLMLFILLAIGVLLAKTKVVNESARKTISEIVLRLLMPCSIVGAFLKMPKDDGILKSFFFAVIVGFALHFFCLGLAFVLYGKQNVCKKAVLRFATISSNAAFIGLPVIEGMFGAKGVFYNAAFLVAMNTFMWSFGVMLFEKAQSNLAKSSPQKKATEIIKKLATQPGIVATVIGVLLVVFKINPPTFVFETVISIGECTTVFSMIVVGHVMSSVEIRKLFTKVTFGFCAVRLIVIPLLTLLALVLIKAPPLLIGVTVVLAGMPAASSTVMLADRYNTQTQFASNLVSLSTAISMLSLPLLAMLTNAVVGH